MFRYALLLPLFLFGALCHADSGGFIVEEFKFKYLTYNEDIPSVDLLYDHGFTFNKGDTYYDSPSEGGESVSLTPNTIKSIHPVPQFSLQALGAIAQQIVTSFNERGYLGVYVSVDSSQINGSGEDLRGDDKSLTYLIKFYRINQVTAAAVGPEYSNKESANIPLHKRILQQSPVHEPQKNLDGSLINVNEVNDFVHLINRYPGRRANILLAASENPEYIDLEYMVTEAKPMKVYVNAANRGSRKGDRWIERVGIFNNHLLNRNLIMTADFVTNSFGDFNSGQASLEGYLTESMKNRWFIRGLWSRFSSSEYGIEDAFVGEQKSATFGARSLVCQHEDLFLDLISSLNIKYINSENNLFGITGSTQFYIPSVGLSLERSRTDSTILANFSVETNMSGLADTDQGELAAMGRASAERTWWMLRSSVMYNVFLDSNVSNPVEQHHQILLWAEGQYACGSRLISQMERAIGGPDSVRGYAQAVASAPNVILGKMEYNYHHYFPDPELRVIGRVFLDMGRTMFVKHRFDEFNSTLVGSGIGGELEWKQNIRFRTDMGIAMKDTVNASAKAGDLFFHLNMTVIY